MYSITLKNIRGIKELVFPFPTRRGVYVLTGTNGCGKTSLMVALNRLGTPWAYSAFPVASHGGWIDLFSNASITYSTPNDEVTYKHSQIRWAPSPKSKSSILTQFPFGRTLFVTASSSRFFSQQTQIAQRARLRTANQVTKDAMNYILETTRFSDLQYYVNPIKGPKKKYYRSDKLYILRKGNEIYSESNFSFGERLLLNTLDALENIQPHTLLLIDEVELALHPRAQVLLYDYLEQQARDKDLAVIISTHSSTLIRHAKNRYFLEKTTQDKVVVYDRCFPAYILKQVASVEDRQYDFHFFVEDDMAEKYLRAVLRRYLVANSNTTHIYAVEPIGGYENVVKFVQKINTLGIPLKKAQAVLDADVQDTYQEWLDKGNNRTASENQKLALFNNMQANITYLTITPELGIWKWIEQNKIIFKSYVEAKHGPILTDIADCIDETSAAEQVNKRNATTPGQMRDWAKGCFKNIKERIHQREHSISEDNVVDYMIDCYVEHTYNNDDVRFKINPLVYR